jgi:hypothetical protein
VDRSDQLPWRKRTVCFYIAAKGVYSWQLHKVIYRYRYPEFSEDVHEYFDYCDLLLYNIYSICIGDVILYVENAFPTETPIYECSIDPWYVPGIHGYDRSLLYLKGNRTVRRILDPLILVYSGGAGLQFYIAKGFFDTIPKSIEEAAYLDGATRWQSFTKIIIPLSRPIIVYTVLNSFLAPWIDFVFAKVICRANKDYYTVSIGLWNMLEKEYVYPWFNSFAAGAVLISVPIIILFMFMQKCYRESFSGGVKG